MLEKPELIDDSYQPSKAVINWCLRMGVTSQYADSERIKFISWYKDKKKKRSDYDLAFKYWLKNSLNFKKKHESVIQKAYLSFSDYSPFEKKKNNKSVGRDALNLLLGRLNGKPK